MGLIQPLVSICLPIYNGEKFLQEALDSIKNQTYENIELIVSDDNSIDNSIEIINNFKKSVSFPVFIYSHNPCGIGANWNNCVINANGEYIKFVFQDDVILPTCIEKMVAAAILDAKTGIVYSKRDFLYDKNNSELQEWVNRYGNLHLGWKDLKIENLKPYEGSLFLKNDNLFEFPENKIGEPTAVLLKKEIFETIGYFSTTLKQTLDAEYWYRVLKKYKVTFIDEELIYFRLHESQATAVNSKNYLNENEQFQSSLYNSLFWFLSFKNQKQFFFKFNTFGKIIKKILGYSRRVKRKLNL